MKSSFFLDNGQAGVILLPSLQVDISSTNIKRNTNGLECDSVNYLSLSSSYLTNNTMNGVSLVNCQPTITFGTQISGNGQHGLISTLGN